MFLYHLPLSISKRTYTYTNISKKYIHFLLLGVDIISFSYISAYTHTHLLPGVVRTYVRRSTYIISLFSRMCSIHLYSHFLSYENFVAFEAPSSYHALDILFDYIIILYYISVFVYVIQD